MKKKLNHTKWRLNIAIFIFAWIQLFLMEAYQLKEIFLSIIQLLYRYPPSLIAGHAENTPVRGIL